MTRRLSNLTDDLNPRKRRTLLSRIVAENNKIYIMIIQIKLTSKSGLQVYNCLERGHTENPYDQIYQWKIKTIVK